MVSKLEKVISEHPIQITSNLSYRLELLKREEEKQHTLKVKFYVFPKSDKNGDPVLFEYSFYIPKKDVNIDLNKLLERIIDSWGVKDLVGSVYRSYVSLEKHESRTTRNKIIGAFSTIFEGLLAFYSSLKGNIDAAILLGISTTVSLFSFMYGMKISSEEREDLIKKYEEMEGTLIEVLSHIINNPY